MQPVVTVCTSTAVKQQQQPPPPASSVPLGEVLASLLWLPASHGWVRPVAAEVVWQLAAGVDAVLVAADRGQLHIAPGLMEEILVGAWFWIQ